MTHLLAVLRAQANMQTNVMAKINLLGVRVLAACSAA